ncbi:MAG: hypothetical protein JW806_01515 [Sedimentisphaerales bacterium]|nr:hypothetical protein [Sedimentisphaerales bacterium]
MISNLTIDANTNQYLGLFGHTSSNCVIKNLGVENANINGFQYIGGLSANDYGNIINCYSTGTVSGDKYVGILVGFKHYENITNCYSTGTVGYNSFIGGLVGKNYQCNISGSYSSADVNAVTNVGGLVGEDTYGSITDCYSTSAVSGDQDVGGLVGLHWTGSIDNCYSTGKVTGNSNTGGLLGYTSAPAYLNNNFWDTDTSQTTDGVGNTEPDPNGVTGKTTTQMQTQSTFTDAGWDFTTPIWQICDGTSYPGLAWQQLITGDFVCPLGVGFEDLDFLSQWWLRTDCSSNSDCDGVDIVMDGTVNFADFALFAEYWLEGI